MRTIALHTRDKPRIMFHKYAEVWTTCILLHIQHTGYKPRMSTVIGQESTLLGMWYAQLRMLSLDANIFVYFLGARLFLQIHAAKILPSSLPTSPVRAHWIIFIFYIN